MLGVWTAARFSHRSMTAYVPLVLPLAVQELVLAVWLIVKGFAVPGGSGAVAGSQLHRVQLVPVHRCTSRSPASTVARRVSRPPPGPSGPLSVMVRRPWLRPFH